MLTQRDYQKIPSLLGMEYTRTPSESSGFYKCPLGTHIDKTPSCNVNFEKGIWHCFSCHESGNLNQLCQRVVGRSIYQVLNIDDFKNWRKKEITAPYVPEKIDEAYIHLDIRGVLLPVVLEPVALNYLKVRGISLEIANKYSLSYASSVYINGRLFKERLMIPIRGKSGALVNMEGRDITRKSPIKVLYPKDSIKPLWNIKNLDTKKTLFITEGIIDALLLEQDSEVFTNVTALLGASASPYQLDMLKQFNDIVTMFDNDEAGKLAHTNLEKTLRRQLKREAFDKRYKDMGEVWEKGGMTVKEFREQGGFKHVTSDMIL